MKTLGQVLFVIGLALLAFVLLPVLTIYCGTRTKEQVLREARENGEID